eukprot:Opistho-2@52807
MAVQFSNFQGLSRHIAHNVLMTSMCDCLPLHCWHPIANCVMPLALQCRFSRRRLIIKLPRPWTYSFGMPTAQVIPAGALIGRAGAGGIRGHHRIRALVLASLAPALAVRMRKAVLLRALGGFPTEQLRLCGCRFLANLELDSDGGVHWTFTTTRNQKKDMTSH